MADVKCYADNDGTRMVLTDDGETVVLKRCAGATDCACDPSRCPHARALVAGILPVGRVFDPMKPTVGDLVGRTLGAAQELSNQVSGCNSECRQLHDAMGLRCSGILCTGVNANSTARFDPRLPTVGDLVGSRTVEAAANSLPVTRRIDGKLDLSRPTVGDLTGLKSVRGHTSMGTISVEPGDITVHPRRIRMC